MSEYVPNVRLKAVGTQRLSGVSRVQPSFRPVHEVYWSRTNRERKGLAMGAPRFVPSDSILANWKAEGLTVAQMVERIKQQEGVEVSALSRAGLTEQIRYDDHIPWSPIRNDHTGHYALSMLRLAARRDAGQQLPEYRLRKLQAWEARLAEDDAVVTYVYASPEGFYYVPRRPNTDVGLVRKP